MNSLLRDDYAQFFDELRRRDWNTAPIETRWMGFLFHITNLDHAISILESGTLFSRSEAQRRQLFRHDSAAAEIISSTAPEVRNCARLYFRPRTPTFYHNEGFRTKLDLHRERYDAHCPVPVAFVFDAATVLAMKGVRFSAVNLASHNARVLETPDEFRGLPFEKIFNEGSVNDRSIILHRQAEVIVPDALDLDVGLRAVRCRSDAERATLRHALSVPARHTFGQYIRTNTQAPLFYAERLFIEKVDLVGDEVIIDLHLPRYPFSFDARFTADFGLTGRSDVDQSWELKTGTSSRLIVPLHSSDATGTQVRITLRLDGLLAYHAILQLHDDVPF